MSEVGEPSLEELVIETEPRSDSLWAAFVVGHTHVAYGATEQEARERVLLMYGVTTGMRIATAHWKATGRSWDQ